MFQLNLYFVALNKFVLPDEHKSNKILVGRHYFCVTLATAGEIKNT